MEEANNNQNIQDLPKKITYLDKAISFFNKYKIIIFLLLGLVVLLLIVQLLFFNQKESRNEQNYNANRVDETNRQENNTNQVVARGTPTSEFKFQRFPFDIENIGSIAPIGEFSGISRNTVANAHWYGNMRHYVFSKEPGKKAYNVYVPADGEIVGFRYSQMSGEYRFNFYVNDKAFYFLDHIQSLSPEIKTKLQAHFGGELKPTSAVDFISPGIPVKAGDVLGKTGLKGIAWDWGFIDQEYCDDIINPDHYKQDQCPRSVYDFLTEEMKAQIDPIAGYWAPPPKGDGLKKVQTKPVLGHYAHDVKGTISGGWFKEYMEPFSQNFFITPDSFLPNALQIKLGIPELSLLGVWNGIKVRSGKVNPDPKKTTTDDGIVVYVLDRSNGRDTSEFGLLLVRLNSDETLTIETVANTTTVPSNLKFSSKAINLKR